MRLTFRHVHKHTLERARSKVISTGHHYWLGNSPFIIMLFYFPSLENNTRFLCWYSPVYEAVNAVSRPSYTPVATVGPVRDSAQGKITGLRNACMLSCCCYARVLSAHAHRSLCFVFYFHYAFEDVLFSSWSWLSITFKSTYLQNVTVARLPERSFQYISQGRSTEF